MILGENTMTKRMLYRFKFFLTASFFIFLLLAGRLAQLQILNHEYFFDRAEINKTRIMNITAPRGEIFDRQGRILATNRPGFTVSILDLERREADRVIAELAKILQMEEEEIRTHIRQQRYRQYIPVRLKSDVSDVVVAELAERRTELPGVIVEVQPLRFYPAGNLAAHVLGRTGEITQRQLDRWSESGYSFNPGDIVGRGGGLEEVFEPFLRGKDGRERVEVNHLTQPVRLEAREDPVPGGSIYLTLDMELQRALEMAMRKHMAARNAEDERYGLRGAAVALDPRSGAILAMVSLPDYDLNSKWQDFSSLRDDPLKPLWNRVIRGTYPAGSTFKMVTALAALEEGVLTPTEKVNSPGVFPVAGGPPKANFGRRAHGLIDVARAIQVSSNTFFFAVSQRLGIDSLERWSRKFGFGAPTGLRCVRGEVAGQVASREAKRKVSPYRWFPAETMDAAIGQGYHEITPLQLANYIAMIANSGTHFRPYLVERIISPAGGVVYQAQAEIINQITASQANWEVIQRGVKAATSLGGTAGRFRNFTYPVQIAGKTGTAEVGGNMPPHSLFLSYAPADNPEIALAVLIENSGTGVSTAVPISWDFYEAYFSPYFEGINNSCDT